MKMWDMERSSSSSSGGAGSPLEWSDESHGVTQFWTTTDGEEWEQDKAVSKAERAILMKQFARKEISTEGKKSPNWEEIFDRARCKKYLHNKDNSARAYIDDSLSQRWMRGGQP